MKFHLTVRKRTVSQDFYSLENKEVTKPNEEVKKETKKINDWDKWLKAFDYFGNSNQDTQNNYQPFTFNQDST